MLKNETNREEENSDRLPHPSKPFVDWVSSSYPLGFRNGNFGFQKSCRMKEGCADELTLILSIFHKVFMKVYNQISTPPIGSMT